MKLIYPALGSDPTNPIRAKKLLVDYLLAEFKKNKVETEIAYFNNSFLKYVFAYRKLFFEKLLKKNYLLMYDKSVLKLPMQLINKKINTSDADFVFCFGSILPGYLRTKKPIYLIIDATFNNLLGYYFAHKNFPKHYIKYNLEVESKAFQNAKKIFVSSQWAADSLLHFYNVPESKIEITPLGANIDYFPSDSEILQIIEKRLSISTNITSIGKHFYQKGMDIAIEIFSRLRKYLPQSKLTIIGCKVPKNYQIEGLHVFEYIDKSNKEQNSLLTSILQETHFFLFPSRAEAYGHVIPEANAFAVPVIANNTGGIPSAIDIGRNGFLFDLSTTKGIDLATETILDFISNNTKYYSLCLSSYETFKSKGNWEIIAKNILNKIKSNLNV